MDDLEKTAFPLLHLIASAAEKEKKTLHSKI
jgi:hypothetical protein